jgi:hypothetical protein
VNERALHLHPLMKMGPYRFELLALEMGPYRFELLALLFIVTFVHNTMI